MEYKNFGADITYSRNEERFIGVVVGASQDLTFSGKSVAELRANFEAIVDKHLARCNAKATDPYRKFSGKLIIRLGGDLHRDITLAAQANNKSVNKWIEGVLREHIARRR